MASESTEHESTHVDTQAGGPVNGNASPLTVSVVVRAFTFDRLDDTRAAIDSVLKQTHTPHEILLIIDNNPELMATMSDDYASEPLVEVMPNNRRQGIGGGSNTALLRATGDIISYLDDDAIAEPDWIESLLEPLADEDVVAVGGLVTPRWAGGEAPSWFPEEFHWVVGCSNPRPDDGTMDIRNVWGGNNAFRRQAVVDNGGFAEKGLGRVGSNALGGEDTELCIRLCQSNPKWRIVYQPKAITRHRVPAPRTTVKYFNTRCRKEGMSKALLSEQIGNQAGLNDEAAYAAFDLPKAVGRNIYRGVRHQRVGEIQKAGAIVMGLGFAVVGMAHGRASIAAGRTEPLEPIERPLVATADV